MTKQNFGPRSKVLVQSFEKLWTAVQRFEKFWTGGPKISKTLDRSKVLTITCEVDPKSL